MYALKASTLRNVLTVIQLIAVYGSTGDDTITCDSGYDGSTGCILFGGGGKDTIFSSLSESILYGGVGADVLYSATGTVSRDVYLGSLQRINSKCDVRMRH